MERELRKPSNLCRLLRTLPASSLPVGQSYVTSFGQNYGQRSLRHPWAGAVETLNCSPRFPFHSGSP